jgi:hypothetical protein
MNETYMAENAAERQRLFSLTSHLTDADLTRKLDDGWTIAAQLAHLAFWDQYALSLVNEWERNGFVKVMLVSVDALNDAAHLLSDAIPPRAALQLARAAAEALDQKLETLTPELAHAIETGGHIRVLRRALHRREHLDEIEKVLGG